MASGFLIVDKPDGWTSQDVAARLRRVFQERRIGHGGTLDPMATGVLPIFVGRATRAAELCQSAEKEYLATLKLGVRTDTQDTTGTVLEEAAVTVSEADVRRVLLSFVGRQQQTPPMYSAVKIGGKKLYELARAGKTVERAPRTVTLFDLELLSGSGDEYRIRVRCSKGTYIRTLCADMGDALGCGGCMASLRRTKAGACAIEQAVPLQTLLDAENPLQYLQPVDNLFMHAPACSVSGAAERRLRNGAKTAVSLPDGEYRVYGEGGEFLLLGRVSGGALDTVKSFFEV